MIELALDNRLLYIGGASRDTIRAIEAIASYRVAGFMFSPAFKKKRWDGMEHLLKHSAKRGYHAPVGLATDICRLLKRRREPYKVRFLTKLRHKRRILPWNEEASLRGYQEDAVKALLAPPVRGSGILKMPIRSGKTRTAGRFIWEIGRPALFIVPSQSLLYQTISALSELFPGVEIGKIGDSEFSLGFITVASIQTLSAWRDGGHWKASRPNKQKRAAWLERHGWERRGELLWSKGRIRPLTSMLAVEREASDQEAKRRKPIRERYKRIVRSFDVVLFDECHHIRGDSGWHNVMYDADARCKVGLSATAYLDNSKENERGIIWLKATCGPIRYDVSVSRLIEEGHLMRQHIRMFLVSKPNRDGHKWSATLHRECIVENRYRNRKIARLAARAARTMKVLIIARLLDHIAAICDAMDDEGLEYRTITGRDSPATRSELVEGLVDGEYQVLIGTVLGEGVDIPSVECVINAEGGSDVKAAVQRQRNLTRVEGKKRALFVDFYDDTNDYFRSHSKARLEAYRAEPSYDVEIVGQENSRSIDSGSV